MLLRWRKPRSEGAELGCRDTLTIEGWAVVPVREARGVPFREGYVTSLRRVRVVP